MPAVRPPLPLHALDHRIGQPFRKKGDAAGNAERGDRRERDRQPREPVELSAGHAADHNALNAARRGQPRKELPSLPGGGVVNHLTLRNPLRRKLALKQLRKRPREPFAAARIKFGQKKRHPVHPGAADHDRPDLRAADDQPLPRQLGDRIMHIRLGRPDFGGELPRRRQHRPLRQPPGTDRLAVELQHLRADARARNNCQLVIHNPLL